MTSALQRLLPIVALGLLAAACGGDGCGRRRSSDSSSTRRELVDPPEAPLTTPSGDSSTRPRLGPDGLHFPVRPKPGEGPGIPPAAAVLPSGDLVLSGSALGGIDLGSGRLDDFQAYLAVLSPEGELRWIRKAPRCQWSAPHVDPSGQILVVVSCGADALGGPQGDGHRLVALRADGGHLWSSDAFDDTLDVFEVSRRGTILIHGGTQEPSAERNEVLVALGSNGKPLSTQRVSGCRKALVQDDGSTLAVIEAENEAGTQLTKRDPSGVVSWTRPLGSPEKSPPGTILLGFTGVGIEGLAALGADTVLAGHVGVTGTLLGRILDGGVQGSMLFARLDPAGKPRWIRVFDTTGRINGSLGHFVFSTANDETIGVGTFSGGVDFGDGKGPIERQEGCVVLRLDGTGRTRNVEVIDEGYRCHWAGSDAKGGIVLSLLKKGEDAEYVIRRMTP